MRFLTEQSKHLCGFFAAHQRAPSAEVVKSEVWTAGPRGRGEDVARLEDPD